MNQYNTAQFHQDLKTMGIHLSEVQTAQFMQYYELLIEWNQRMNLTAITDYESVIKKHFIDSLSLIKAYDISSPISLIDVGTGAGFPGLALKIAFPHCRVTLLDSLNKRVQFLNAVIEALGLREVQALHGRAEDFARPGNSGKAAVPAGSASSGKATAPAGSGTPGKAIAPAGTGSLRESFDLCVSRAVANLSTLSEYCLPFVKPGGCFIAYKSENAANEIDSAEKAISLLGGKVEEKKEFLLPDSDIYRCLFIIRKERPTPKKYPRKAGVPGKEPL